LRTLLHWLAAKLPPPRVIYDRAGESPYLSRWYLLRHASKKGFALFLHRFHRGDDDVELHNHPWKWSASLILSGGYREERRVRVFRHHWTIVTRELRPGQINIILGDDIHRVELLDGEAWSIFLAGPHTGAGWGFWNRVTKEFTPWREFITRKRGPEWEES
jgi:hypothetical protein